MDLLSNFRNKQIVRSQIQCPDDLNIWLDYCQYMIHAEFDKGTKEIYKYKKRKNQINQNFKNAIENFNREQKVQFYLRLVKYLQTLHQGLQDDPHRPLTANNLVEGQCQCRSFNLKIWKQKKIRLYKDRHQIMVENEKDAKIKSYQLRNYLLRKSKIKDKHVLVLEAINDKPHQKSRTVHIAFKDSTSLKKWFELIKQQIQFCEWLNVKDMYNGVALGSNVKSSSISYKNKSNISQKSQTQSVDDSEYFRQNSKNSQISYKASTPSVKSSIAKTNQNSSTIQNKKQNNSNNSQTKSNLTKKSSNISSEQQTSKSQKDVDTKSIKSQKKSSVSQQKSPKTTKSQQKKGSSSNQLNEQQIFRIQQNLNKQEQQLSGKRKTFIEHLVNDDCTNFDQFYDVIQNQTENDVQHKKNLDFFHKLMPEYDLDQLFELSGYQSLLNEDSKFQVLKNIDNPNRFKLLVTLSSEKYKPKTIFSLISQPRNALQINDNISELTIKTLLKSQNSAITYQVLKPYNKFYRSRDFIFVRHGFQHKNNLYIVDKSIDNINFPPFITLVRGQMSALWGIVTNQKQKTIMVYGDFTITNAGLLSAQQQINLSLRYLSAFKLLLKIQPSQQQESSLFDISWDIDNKEINKKTQQLRVRRKTITIEKNKIEEKNKSKASTQNNQLNNHKFVKKSSAYMDVSVTNGQQRSAQTSPSKYNIPQDKYRQVEENSPQKEHIQEKQQKVQVQKKSSNTQHSQKKPDLGKHKPQETKEHKQNNTHSKDKKVENQKHPVANLKPSLKLQVIRKLDKQGMVITDKGYTKRKFFIKPIEKQAYVQYPKIKGHAIWKGDWIHDVKAGGIIFTNQKKIQDQKGVLKFILTKIGKNILSGKSVLNISLPVDIFAAQSNLERLLLSMSYGPKLLQNLNSCSPIEKLIKTVAFGVSNSVLYLNMEKPFNPILGETFQCWINGCPGYAQQISHHPPIAALMFYGRGYKITCQLESKVQLHMNSGCGINDGIYKVQFDDGTQICFITPGGQVSGLTYGDRKFNLVGKSYYWMYKQRIVLQLNYDIGKKSFFSKQDKPSDFFQGKIYQVTNQFFNTFPKSKKRQPTDKQKVRQLGKFQGVWNKYVKFNDKQILNFDRQVPLRIQYEQQPLASDANWREDIQYRRLDKITRAQTQKQRLEVIQRTDRKFRAKYSKK